MPIYIEISWDERSEDHIARHGVDPEEVEEVIGEYQEFRRHGNRYIAIGQTHSDRYLTVVLEPEPDGCWYVVTARPSTRTERRRIRR